MKIPSADHKDILLAALQERYSAVHTIRERVQTVALWVLGLLVAGAGWFFQSDICIGLIEKMVLAFFAFAIWMVIKFFYFKDLEKGFNSQRVVLAKIEEALGFFEKSYFTNKDEALYPESWKKSGQKNCEGNFMKNNYNLVALGFLIFVVAVFFF